MTISVREKYLEVQLLSIITDLGLPENVPFVEILNTIFALQYPWKDVDGAENLPVGEWLVRLENQEVHTAQVYEVRVGTVAVIRGVFYYDLEKVVAYAPIPAYIEPIKTEQGDV